MTGPLAAPAATAPAATAAPADDDPRRPLSACQRRLSALWFGLTLPSAALLFAQSVVANPVYGGRTKDAWSWYVPLVVPTLSLIVGTIVRQAGGGARDGQTVSLSAFRLAAGLSAAYLAAVLVALVAAARATGAGGPFDVLTSATFLLAPLQSLVVLALGAFFVSSRPAAADGGGERRPGGA